MEMLSAPPAFRHQQAVPYRRRRDRLNTALIASGPETTSTMCDGAIIRI